MEPVGAFLDEEWASLIRMFSGEETDLGTHWPSNEANMNNDGPVDEGLMFHFSDTFCSDLHHFSRESSNTSGSNNSVSFPTPSHENYCSFTDSNHFDQERNNHNHNSLVQTSIDFGVMDNGNNSSFPIFADNCVMEDILAGGEKLGNGDGDDQVQEIDGDSGKELQLKRKLDAPELHAGEEEKRNESVTQTPKKKKKSRVSGEAQKEKRKAPWRKNQKLALHGNDEEETNNAGRNVQNSSCCSSDDDSSAFDHQELNNGGEISDSKLGFSALNSKGKTRASRGTATDPQSLYARKRRERINERLRILQNLVPNGTKVDISTMLEEAVHYVKFLQLQIKLLSSDDLWMYAPIAYNGMDIGLYSNISPTP